MYKMKNTFWKTGESGNTYVVLIYKLASTMKLYKHNYEAGPLREKGTADEAETTDSSSEVSDEENDM